MHSMNPSHAGRAASPVDRRSPIPAYHQLARLFRARIDRGDWRPGEQLPTEVELADYYRVSRSTIRQALTQLADESYVRREHGKGTFASPPSRFVLTDLSLPLGLAHRSRAQGIGYSTVRRRLELARTYDPVVVEKLGGEEGVEVVEFERAILLNGARAAVSTSWLPASRFGRMVEDGLREDSVSLTLREDFGLELARYENEVEVHDADPERAEILGIASTDPLLVLTAVCYSSDHDVVEVSRTFWRTDMVRLRFGLDVAELAPRG
jgi:GntR family transcriptional regulator